MNKYFSKNILQKSHNNDMFWYGGFLADQCGRSYVSAER